MIHEFSDEELADVRAGTRLRVAAPLLDPLEVEVRPILPDELREAEAEARQRLRLRLFEAGMRSDTMASRAVQGIETRFVDRAIVRRATMCPGSDAPFFSSADEVEQLDACTLATLLGAWKIAQERSAPARDGEEARRLRKALARSSSGMEAAIAHYATALRDYYGKPARELTPGQVAAFLAAREGP